MSASPWVVGIVVARGAASEVHAGLVAPGLTTHQGLDDPKCEQHGAWGVPLHTGGRCPRRDKLSAVEATGGDDDSNRIIAQEGPVIARVEASDSGPPASLHAEQAPPG